MVLILQRKRRDDVSVDAAASASAYPALVVAALLSLVGPFALEAVGAGGLVATGVSIIGLVGMLVAGAMAAPQSGRPPAMALLALVPVVGPLVVLIVFWPARWRRQVQPL